MLSSNQYWRRFAKLFCHQLHNGVSSDPQPRQQDCEMQPPLQKGYNIYISQKPISDTVIKEERQYKQANITVVLTDKYGQCHAGHQSLSDTAYRLLCW